MWSISLVMIDCPLSGRSLGYVSNFCISDLENFATENRRCIGVINKLVDSTVSLWITPTTVERVVAECTSLFVDCNALTPFLRFFSGLVVQVVPTLLFSSWQDYEWHIASRGPSVIAELLVIRNLKRAKCASMRKSLKMAFTSRQTKINVRECQAVNVQCIAPLPMAFSNPQYNVLVPKLLRELMNSHVWTNRYFPYNNYA